MLETLKTAALSPYYAASVFSQAKSFRHNPILGSAWLNERGLHGARVALARRVTALRRGMLSGLLSAEERAAFARDGFLRFEGFLPDVAFDALLSELKAARLDGRQMRQGDTKSMTALLDPATLAGLPATLAGLPATRAAVEDPRLLRYSAYVGARWKAPLAFVLTIKNGLWDGLKADPQKTFHSDTFHSTMKAWLFLDDVTPERGPLHYAPGSHEPTPERRAWERDKAIAASKGLDRYEEKGSFRATEAEIAAMGYAPAVSMTGPANTLVIADTYGFHRRGDAEPGAVRPSLYFSSRSNPFNPWPGLPLQAWRRLEHGFIRGEWAMADRNEARGGKRASWRKAPGANFFA